MNEIHSSESLRQNFALTYAKAYVNQYVANKPVAGKPAIDYRPAERKFVYGSDQTPAGDDVRCCVLEEDMLGGNENLPSDPLDASEQIAEYLTSPASDDLWAEVAFRIDWELEHR